MKLVWSHRAVAELRQIRRFSTERWGAAVAASYLDDLFEAATRAAAQPGRCRSLRGKLHLLRVRSHFLIVEIDRDADRVTVARVLHTAMNIERWLA